jgi:integrase
VCKNSSEPKSACIQVLPTRGKTPAKVCLFPDEERRLLGCTKLPIAWRLLIGILSREGMRLSELLRLEWSDVDLSTGTLTLDKNKTDRTFG